MNFYKLLSIMLSLAFLANPSYSQDKPLPFTISADNFSYSEDGSELVANGTVYVFTDSMSLKADRLIYNQKTSKIYAKGNVIMLDKQLNTTYSKDMELTGDLKRGVADEMTIMFAGTTGVMESSRAVKVNENKLNMFDISYTACPLVDEDETLPWEIKSSKVSYDSIKERVIYKNAVINLFEIPVFYTPVFYHTTNFNKPMSGVLPITIASSSSTGFGFNGGYYFNINENNDATVRFRYMGQTGTILGLEHRYADKNFASDVKIEGLSDKNNGEHARGMLDAEAEYTFAPGKRAGVNALITSDEDYLEEFKDISDSYRYSTIYAESASDDHYIGASSRHFIDMRDDVDDNKLAQPVGRLQLEKIIKTDPVGGQVKLSSDILSLRRDIGQDTNRVITFAEYLKPFYSPDGSLFEFTASARGDYYSFNTNDAGSSNENESRFLPTASLSWEKPFVSSSFKHIISPKVMFIASPEEDQIDIPNEDSTSFELDSANLFEKNRFSGYDRIESGNRIVYGIDSKYARGNGLSFHGFLGQSYNFSDKQEEITGSLSKNSDWVGFLKVNPNKNFSAGTDFRLDSNGFGAQRVDSYIKLSRLTDLSTEEDYFKISHNYLKNDSDEINLTGYYNLKEDYALTGRVQRNMSENITLTQEMALVYKQCCYDLSFKVQKTQSDDDDREDSLDFLFNFSILPTGRAK